LTSAATWAVPCRPSTSPSCFGPQLVGPSKHEIESGRALPGLVSKNKAQHGTKTRRASVGPCWPRHDTYRPLHLGRRRATASSAFPSFFLYSQPHARKEIQMGCHAAGFCMPLGPARGNSNGLRHKRSCFRDRKVWAARRNRPFASSLSTSPLVQSARGIERSAGLANKNRAGLARARPTKACRATWAVGPPAEARPGPSNVPC
jgi:hypothetical protein